MCEQSETDYLDGEVVWVKLGSCWWPGEVVGSDKLPPDVLPSFRKPPIAVVKFFQEDTYEYVKNNNLIYKYNCSRKNEFINKGLYMFRTKHGHMDKFPEDVIRAETATDGDTEILSRDEFQETKKESYAGLFGDPLKRHCGSGKKGKMGRGRPTESLKYSTPISKHHKLKSDYKVHILVQGTKSTPNQPTENVSTPSTSRAGSEPSECRSKTEEIEAETVKINEKQKQDNQQIITPSTPTNTASGTYVCHACPFTTTRLNVLILHNKTHSVTFTPYTPSPVRKKMVLKSTPNTLKTPKQRKPKKEKSEKVDKKLSLIQKRVAEEKPKSSEAKKSKTDQEIKSSLLADWDDVDEESNDESSTMVMDGSPEDLVGAESPAVPTPTELPSAQVPPEVMPPIENKSDETVVSEKPETASDSKYEFCEDEDWPVEADGGRKIPRVKNPSTRKEETKSLSLDANEVVREVAELLNKTTVPDLPSAPEPLKVEENFPEPSVIKSPDKKPEKPPEDSKILEKVLTETLPTKTIFKTKTFFRSRHSRSQDAIGKYVAEQLNAAERMDIESEINGSDTVSSPEARESPPVEQIRVARLAPKIQLKKMKAEAQLREMEKLNQDLFDDNSVCDNMSVKSESPVSALNIEANKNELNTNNENVDKPDTLTDVLYPTQEIKPINTESNDKNINKENKGDDKLKTYVRKKCDSHESSSSLYTTVANIEPPIIKFPETSLEKPCGQPYMNESTASAVDALLSVSRDADRVTRIISNDPPEDLFEDDNKDSSINNNINGFNDNINKGNELHEHCDNYNLKTYDDETIVIQNNFNGAMTLKPSPQDIKQIIEIPKESSNYDTTISNNSAIVVEEIVAENVPSESDLQVAEALINLPATAIQCNATNDPIENKPQTCKEILPHKTDEIENNQKLQETNQFQNEDHKEINATLQSIEVSHVSDHLHENEPANELVTDKHIEIVENSDQFLSNKECEEIVIGSETVLEDKFHESPMLHDNEPIHNENVESMVVADDNVFESKDKIIKKNDMPSKTVLLPISENLNVRFETEQEKSENLNAAQSLVQMSESIDHKMNIIETNSLNDKKVSSPESIVTKDNGADNGSTVEQKLASLSSDNNSDVTPVKTHKFETSSSKLLKILEEPCTSNKSTTKMSSSKSLIIPGNEKILNFEVANASLKGKSHTPKQKILIRRALPNRNIINSFTEVTTPDKIILSRNKPSDGSGIQTYTIQATPEVASDTNTIIIQQKLRKVTKTPKLHKIKEPKSTSSTDEAIFDINSMPVVLSDDILTPESIEKMPIVMSDGNIITNQSKPPKLVKTKQTVVESEKSLRTTVVSKPELKTLLMNPVTESSKVTTPNILSKSSKLRGGKPMLVIDKATGKQKIIMTKSESSTPVKEIKQAQTILQPAPQNIGKTEKFIIVPTGSSPRPTRTQKIVIDPQTGKAHVLVAKGPESSLGIPENKQVSAKLIPPSSDTNTSGNTVMIITNAQGAQSRIVLTPEHEKMLFPNKQQQPNVPQLKTITHRISTNTVAAQKTVVTTVAPLKMQTRIVPKQKSAIITSKGQLIVGGRVATTSQNIAPMPEIRPAPKRIIATEPKRVVQTIQRTVRDPLIFLQQKTGSVVQLTAAQFDQLHSSGQIIQRVPQENKIIVQKSITFPTTETVITNVQKQRVRKSTATSSPTPAKKVKQEIAIAPAPPPVIPALTPLSNAAVTSLVPSVPSPVSVASAPSYPDLDNLEELLPSTAIARPPEPVVTQPEQPAPVPPAPLSADGQLLAVPGENFGGPPGSFYLCVEENGTFTAIDNRPLVLENNQLMPMAMETMPVLAPQPERRDILEAALANSDVFHAETPRDDAPDFRDLNANVSVHCRVSETSTTLNQPIMTPVEVPTKADGEPAVPTNLEDGLAVIGVTPQTVPTSLELPITVTDPRIAPKTTDPLRSNNFGATLLPSPNTDMTFLSTDDTDVVAGPISMPLLTDEEAVGKSMPILTDELGERTASSLESTVGSPCSGTEPEEGGGQWSRRLLTPGSDTSEASSEIPLQPLIQLTVNDLSRTN